MSRHAFHLALPFAACLALAHPSAPLAQEQNAYTYNFFGTPGLIDMPTAQSAEDAEIAATMSYFGGTTRTTLSFQIFPRLSGSFRYSKINRWAILSGGDTFDRSFDLRYRLVDETRYRPAIAIGLQDFIGTGIYSGEYVAATKHLTPALAVTGGIGWGRLGSYNSFDNPLGVLDDRFKVRGDRFDGTGGEIESANWFRGDAAFFGGVSWQATDRLALKAEYSSDAYTGETTPGRDLFERKSPFNFSASYKIRKNISLQMAYLYGDTIGFSVTASANPRKPTVFGGGDLAPIPVKPRDPRAEYNLGWTGNTEVKNQLRDGMATVLKADGILLEAVRFEGTKATVHIRNERYIARAQAIGRTARTLTQAMPDSVETFTIIPMVNGLPTSAVILKRSDLEELEHDSDGAWRMLARADIVDTTQKPAKGDIVPDQYPRFTWSLGPYTKANYFDPDAPVRVDFGLRLAARYDLAPGLFLSGTVDHRLAGNRDESTRNDPSALARVRSDANIYAKTDTQLTHLTLASHFRPGKDLYGRVTAGYLEPMYAGVSGELLWKPVDSRLGLGVELNYVKQRDFEDPFAFRDYSVATGHASAYYDFGNGYHGRLDAGRYLAGDWGGTLTLSRQFANGWKVGAYATLTDVSFDDFGEGSFDKGIQITIPLDHFAGRSTGSTFGGVIQPISRDGGARVNVNGRLYEQVRDFHQPELRKTWGRFWR